MRTRLESILKFAGWSVFVAVIASAAINAILRNDIIRNLDGGGDHIAIMTIAYLFGFLIESPYELSIGTLCLFAANYLGNSASNLETIFE